MSQLACSCSFCINLVSPRTNYQCLSLREYGVSPFIQLFLKKEHLGSYDFNNHSPVANSLLGEWALEIIVTDQLQMFGDKVGYSG